MDWIKVKVKHAEYEMAGAPDNVFKAWIMLMILTAALEKIPTPKQIEARIGNTNYQSLIKYLKENGTKVEDILAKVMEDVELINNRREHERKYMSEYRGKALHKPLRKRCVSGKDKIREDKIREDKIREDKIREQDFASQSPAIRDIVHKTAEELGI
jgi:hypothetical protein